MAELDQNYCTPAFTVPVFDKKHKLKGYRNFRQWKAKLELSLETNMLLLFIKSENGQTVNISPGYRLLLNAQTVQVLQASVSPQVLSCRYKKHWKQKHHMRPLPLLRRHIQQRECAITWNLIIISQIFVFVLAMMPRDLWQISKTVLRIFY